MWLYGRFVYFHKLDAKENVTLDNAYQELMPRRASG